MKISQFMQKALFDEKTGYYLTKNPLGKDSDFITAPEISQVFGELLAAYLLQITTDKNSKISLVEMGAGRGVMLRDILRSIKSLADKNIPQAVDFLKKTEFHIIEINEVLQKVQKDNLKDFDIKWHGNFSSFLKEIPGESSEIGQGHSLRGVGGFSGEILFISNELLDCYPIDQYILTEIGWRERIIKDQKFTLAEFNKETHKVIESEVGKFAPLGGVFEVSESAQSFTSELCQALKIHGGIAINFDYGYLKNQFANTLQALKTHKKTSIFEKNCDLTSHVNFAALDKITKNHGLNSSLITQKEFLTSLGIEERRKKLLAKNPQSANEINSSIDRLINSDKMGELFKCHIIWK
jgi:SAM-dependent MidA family methyltransferase